MSIENEVSVRIVGDASQVAPAIQVAKGEISGLSEAIAAMSAQMAALGETMAATMAPAAAATAEMAAEMKVLIGETEKEAFSLREVAVSAHEGLQALHEMRESLAGFGELLLAAFAVEAVAHFAEGIAEAAEKTNHLAQRLGVPVQQVQALTAATAATGVPMDALVKGMGLLDKKFETEPALFKKLGIELPKNASQMQILNATMERFKNLDDGPAKTALALDLMGRAGAALIPFLNKGAAGLAELTKEAVKYGAVNAEASEKGHKLAESMNEGSIAMLGFKLTLADAFAPLLKEAVDGLNEMVASMTASYKAGGSAKIIFTAISGTLEALGSVISVAAQALAPLGDLFILISDNIETILPVAAALGTLLAGPYVAAATAALIATIAQSTALTAMAAAFELNGIIGVVSLAFGVLTTSIAAATTATVSFTIALLANPLTWVAVAASAAAAGLVWLAEHVRSTGEAFAVLKDVVRITMEVIKAEIVITGDIVKAFGLIAMDAMTLNWGAIQGDWQAGLNNVVAEVREAAGKIKAIQADLAKHLVFGPKPGKPAGPEKPEKPPGTGETPDFEHHAKPKKAKTAKDDLVQNLEAELTAKKLAWSMEQDAQNGAQAYSLESEAAYWKDALARHELSTKDRMTIEQKYLEAHGKLIRQDITRVLDGFKDQLQAAKASAADRERIVAAEAAYVKLKFGPMSTEYAAMQKEMTRAAQDSADEQRRITDELAAHVAKLAQADIAAAEAQAKFRVAMGLETNAELLRDQLKFEKDRWAATDARLAKEIAGEKTLSLQWQKLTDQRTETARIYEAKRTALTRQATLERTAIERQGITSVSNLFGQNIAKMLTLQQNFAASLHSLYTGLVGTVGNALGSILEQWLAKHIATLLLGGAASKVAGTGQIATAAAIAGANGVASMALAPFPLDLGAPEFGIAMSAAASAFSAGLAVPGFAVGAMNLSKDQLAMVHAGEMIIPADQAGGWRNIMSMFADMPRMGLPAGLTRPVSSMLSDGGAVSQDVAARARARLGIGGDDHGGGGATHNYYAPVIHGDLKAIDTRSGTDFLMKHHGTAMKAGAKAVRNGYQPPRT